RAGVERAPELLEQERLLEEAEPGAACFLRHGHAEPAEPRELVPGRGVPACLGVGELGHALGREAVGQEGARLPLELVLLGVELELHYLLLGSPSTRS